MIEVLALVASVHCDLSCCSIEGCDVELLIKGTEQEALDCAFVMDTGHHN